MQMPHAQADPERSESVSVCGGRTGLEIERKRPGIDIEKEKAKEKSDGVFS